MDVFMKASGLIIVSLILGTVLTLNNKGFGVLISVAACCAVCVCALHFLKPVLEFFQELRSLGNWNHEMLEILLKATGIGILSEMISLICSDSGNAALGKALQMLTTAVIVWLSLPLFTQLIELIRQILGKI